jgi:hypothetical protein
MSSDFLFHWSAYHSKEASSDLITIFAYYKKRPEKEAPGILLRLMVISRLEASFNFSDEGGYIG